MVVGGGKKEGQRGWGDERGGNKEDEERGWS